MFSNKNSHINRTNRIDSSSRRSTTPQHNQTQKPHRTSQSQSKPIATQITVASNLSPIEEQM